MMDNFKIITIPASNVDIFHQPQPVIPCTQPRRLTPSHTKKQSLYGSSSVSPPQPVLQELESRLMTHMNSRMDQMQQVIDRLQMEVLSMQRNGNETSQLKTEISFSSVMNMSTPEDRTILPVLAISMGSMFADKIDTSENLVSGLMLMCLHRIGWRFLTDDAVMTILRSVRTLDLDNVDLVEFERVVDPLATKFVNSTTDIATFPVFRDLLFPDDFIPEQAVCLAQDIHYLICIVNAAKVRLESSSVSYLFRAILGPYQTSSMLAESILRDVVSKQKTKLCRGVFSDGVVYTVMKQALHTNLDNEKTSVCLKLLSHLICTRFKWMKKVSDWVAFCGTFENVHPFYDVVTESVLNIQDRRKKGQTLGILIEIQTSLAKLTSDNFRVYK